MGTHNSGQGWIENHRFREIVTINNDVTSYVGINILTKCLCFQPWRPSLPPPPLAKATQASLLSGMT